MPKTILNHRLNYCHSSVNNLHLKACGNAGAQVMCGLKLLALLMHDEGAQAVQLEEVGLLQDLPPRLPVHRQHAGAVAQEVEDQPKVLRVPVDENPSLHRTALVRVAQTLWLVGLTVALPGSDTWLLHGKTCAQMQEGMIAPICHIVQAQCGNTLSSRLFFMCQSALNILASMEHGSCM